MVTGSGRRTVPCTVSSRANAVAQTSTAVVTAPTNIEPDAASGETKSVVIISYIAVGRQELACCTRLLSMVGFPRPSAKDFYGNTL